MDVKRCLKCGCVASENDKRCVECNNDQFSTISSSKLTTKDAFRYIANINKNYLYDERRCLGYLADIVPDLQQERFFLGTAFRCGAIANLRKNTKDDISRAIQQMANAGMNEAAIGAVLEFYGFDMPTPKPKPAPATPKPRPKPIPSPPPQNPPVHTDPPRHDNSRILFAFFAIIAIALIGFVVSSIPDTAIRTSNTLVKPADAKNAPAESPNTTSANTQTDASIPIRDSINAYSWEELSHIAAEVQKCTTRSDALAISERYNLTGPNGKLYDLGKSVLLNGETTIEFRLVDVYHDEADTVSGKAGLSFLSKSIISNHQMSTGKYTEGGWEASAMRSWLSSSVWNSLPSDLRTVIIPVHKRSNNVGNSRTTSCVTQTTDKIWLPSIVELSGNVAWEYFTEPQNANLFNAVFNAEGYQYEFFSQQGIVDDQPNQVLALSANWWLRSTAASTGRGRFVNSDGDPSSYGDSNENWGVVFGFCL